jgi:hypothetical protein
LPGGELCVYGLNEVKNMTQFKQKDICPESHKTANVASFLLIIGISFILLKRK